MLVLSFCGFSNAAETVSNPKRDLRSLDRRLEKKKEEQSAAQKKSLEIRQEVRRLSRELSLAQQSLRETERRLVDTERQRQEAEDRAHLAADTVENRRQWLAGRLEALAKDQAAGRQDSVVAQKAVIRQGTQQLSQAFDQHTQAVETRNDLAALQVKLDRLRARREQDLDDLKEFKGQLVALRRTVEGRRAVLENEILELKRSRRALNQLVDRLAKESTLSRQKEQAARRALSLPTQPETYLTSASRMKLPWPVKGDLVEKFGRSQHPELDTVVVSNGIRLRTSPGAQVHAVDEGEVLFAGTFMNYGLMALVSHPGQALSVYARLGALQVREKQTIASGDIVGVAGSDEEGRGEVYFELRVGGHAVDPLKWLR